MLELIMESSRLYDCVRDKLNYVLLGEFDLILSRILEFSDVKLINYKSKQINF